MVRLDEKVLQMRHADVGGELSSDRLAQQRAFQKAKSDTNAARRGRHIDSKRSGDRANINCVII